MRPHDEASGDRASRVPSGGHPSGHPRERTFATAYEHGDAPWDIGGPQPDLAALADASVLPSGRMLDVGCGRGDNALYFAERGWEVIGIDGVAEAIESATEKAAERGLQRQARFVHGDVFAEAQASGTYDAVVDSGFFHGLDDAERVRFANLLAGLLRPGGVYAMLSFSDKVPGDWGPRRVSEREIRAVFCGPDLEVVEVTPARFQSAFKEMPFVDANLALVRRR